MKKLPSDFTYLADMYEDDYFPKPLVDRLQGTLKETVDFLESGKHSTSEIQDELDRMTQEINELQDAFLEAKSELETIARESISTTVEEILKYFEIAIDVEDALRLREW